MARWADSVASQPLLVMSDERAPCSRLRPVMCFSGRPDGGLGGFFKRIRSDPSSRPLRARPESLERQVRNRSRRLGVRLDRQPIAAEFETDRNVEAVKGLPSESSRPSAVARSASHVPASKDKRPKREKETPMPLVAGTLSYHALRFFFPPLHGLDREEWDRRQRETWSHGGRASRIDGGESVWRPRRHQVRHFSMNKHNVPRLVLT